MTRTLFVVGHWDAEEHYWWADSDDIPGLVTEAPSFEELVDRVLAIAPDIVEMNEVVRGGEQYQVKVRAERAGQVLARAS